MHATIKKTSDIKKDHSLVIIITDPKQIDYPILTKKQINYARKRFNEKGNHLVTINQFDRIIFIHLPKKEEDYYKSLENIRLNGEKIVNINNKHKVENITITGIEISPSELLAIAEGMVLSNYQFLKYKKNLEEKTNSLENIYLLDDRISEEQIYEINILLESTYICRNLVNEPLSSLNSISLAEEFLKMAKDTEIKTEVFNKKKIESLKMGGILAVNRGSKDPPTFTIMEWKPKNAINEQPFVLVGKGVVFDTGGMSIKPANGMITMKCDMAGAATMASVIYAIAKLKLPMYIIALLPATDNRISADAYVPGDVISMHDGTTVEIINTDAEGRMILADALSYAKKYNPQLVINAATLTGAAARAIGKNGIAAMSSGCDEDFATLSESGWNVYERLAPLPFWDEYKESIKSDIADIKNLGGVEAGAITAGKFLEHFTDYPFIHLDIAGVAYLEKKDKYRGLGGTGIGVRLLIDFFKRKLLFQ